MRKLASDCTGGSRGIGYAIAHELVEHGASLSICARGAPALEEAASALRAAGGEVYAEALDVADGAALSRWVQNSAESMGGVDIVIHNASAMIGEGDSSWQANLAVDLLGANRLVMAALPGRRCTRIPSRKRTCCSTEPWSTSSGSNGSLSARRI